MVLVLGEFRQAVAGISSLGMLLIYRVDLEKYGLEDEDLIENDNGKKQIDTFFLKIRSSMNDRFVPTINEERQSIRSRIKRR